MERNIHLEINSDVNLKELRKEGKYSALLWYICVAVTFSQAQAFILSASLVFFYECEEMDIWQVMVLCIYTMSL